MATDQNHLEQLMAKLESLPPDRIAEVEDFIDFLKAREQDRLVVNAGQRLAEPVFEDIWNNPDDADYDKL